jgi:hypothetical protein
MSLDEVRPRVRRIEPEEFVDLLVSRRHLSRVPSVRDGSGARRVPRFGLFDPETGELFVPRREPRSVCGAGGTRDPF